MNPSVSRRRFVTRSALALAGLSLLPTPAPAAGRIVRKGGPRLRLGLAAYSFRDYMKHVAQRRQGNVDESKRIDLPELIDFAADQNCDGIELTAYYFPPDVSREYLLNVRRHAFLRGIEICGSAVGNTFALPSGSSLKTEIESVKTWIGHCAVMGAPHLRVFAGEPKGLSQDEAVKQCVRALKECGDYAAGRGVMLGVENHGGMVSDVSVLEQIINETDHDWVGVNLDTGNFYSADPYADMTRLAPYAVNVQYKVEINHVPGGRKPAELERVIGILREAKYQGYVTLEYEAAENPWEAVPLHLKKLRSALG